MGGQSIQGGSPSVCHEWQEVWPGSEVYLFVTGGKRSVHKGLGIYLPVTGWGEEVGPSREESQSVCPGWERSIRQSRVRGGRSVRPWGSICHGWSVRPGWDGSIGQVWGLSLCPSVGVHLPRVGASPELGCTTRAPGRHPAPSPRLTASTWRPLPLPAAPYLGSG